MKLEFSENRLGVCLGTVLMLAVGLAVLYYLGADAQSAATGGVAAQNLTGLLREMLR